MATVTLNRLIALLGKATGFYTSGTASGTHSTTTVQDNSADSEVDSLDTNLVSGKWLRIPTTTDAAAPVGEARKSSSVATSTITVDTAYSAAPADGDTYELLPYHPSMYIDAIQESIRTLSDVLYLPLRNETLVIDNLLSNGDFETTTSGPVFTGWSSVGTPTLATETGVKMHGSQSISIAASGATEGVRQNILDGGRNVFEMVGKTLHVRGWLFAQAPSVGTLRITYDSSTYETDTHSGSDQWEYLSLDSTIPDGATVMDVQVVAADGSTIYADHITAWIDPVSRYTIPSAFINGVYRISVQADEHDPSGYYVPVTSARQLAPGRFLRLEGKGRLTVPTAGTGTTEVDEPQAELIVAQAAYIMSRRLANTDLAGRDRHLDETARWANEVERLKRKPGIRSPGMAADLPRQGFPRVGRDADGSYLFVPR